MKYTAEELAEARRQIDSTLHKLQEVVKTLEAKEEPAPGVLTGWHAGGESGPGPADAAVCRRRWPRPDGRRYDFGAAFACATIFS